MLHFPQRDNAAPRLYADETDAPLPETLNPKLRYAYFSTIATGGKSLIQSCRDLYLGRTVCYKTCLLYTSPSPRDATLSRMPSSA